MKPVEAINERPDSCEISINAKGLFSGKVKVYAETIEEAMKNALEKAAELEVLIKEKNGGKNEHKKNLKE